MRLALNELGPAFIKLGQLLSTRTDFFQKEVVDELEKLDDNAEPFDFSEVEKIFSEETGLKISEAFKSFEKKPIASASIAQVHKAVLKNGSVVAVKVQRPNAEEEFKTDVEILKQAATLIEKYFEEARIYNPSLMVEEFERSVNRELDFRVEARNAERFRNNFKQFKDVLIPKVHSTLSGRKILVLDFAEGVSAKQLKASAKEKKELAEKITFLISKQIFIDGFFNADPHQGNFLFTKKKVAMIDFGMVGFVDDEMKEIIGGLYSNLVQKNLDAFMDNFVKISKISDESDVESFKSEMNDFIEEFYGVTPNQIEIGRIFFELSSMARRYKISINPKFLLLAKVFVSLEGMQKTLDPDFNMIENAKIFIKEVAKEQSKPSNIAKKTMKNLSSIQTFLTTFPPKITQILDKAGSGKFKMEFEHVGLEKPVYRIDRAVNKVSISMIIAALLVSSSLIILAKAGPLFDGFSILGFFGLALALFLSFWLATAILLEGEF